jgi:4-amino-4-deoxy-L-arabinose transferase and related glycosyltransferases of PMT family
MFLVILPWYGTMAYLHGSDFVDTFLGFHNLTRFASPEHPDKNRWYFYIPVLLVGFFPWCTLLLQSMYRSLTETGKKSSYLLFFNIWAILVFLFFSAAQTKLVSYILPMYPAVAILVGWYINEIWDEYYVPARSYGWIILLFILLVGFSYGSWKGLAFFPGTENAGLFLLFDFAFLGVFSLYFLWKKQTSNAFLLHILGMVGFAFIISGMLFPLVSGQFSSAAIAQEFKALDKDPAQSVYISKFLRPGVAFYSDIYGTEYDPGKSVQEIDALVQKNPQAWFILRQVDYDALPSVTKNRLILIQTVDNNMILQAQSDRMEEPVLKDK